MGPRSLFIWSGLGIAMSAHAANINYVGKKVSGVWYHAVVANLNSEDVKASGIVNARFGHSEPIWTMISRAKPTVAISGTFFDVRSARPIGSIVIEGNGVVDGYHGSCLVIDYFNQAAILDPKWGRKMDTTSFRYMVRGGVRILTGGEITCYPKAQKFKDSRVWSKARRIGVGVTTNNKLVFVATNSNVTLSALAGALKQFGARNAIALDGGTSAAFYYRGKLLVKPGRKLTNLVTLHESPGIAWAALPAKDTELASR